MLYLNENLKYLREAKNLSRQDVYEYLGLNKTTYNNYETGVSKPDYLVLEKLTKKYNRSAHELLYIQLSKQDKQKQKESISKGISNSISNLPYEPNLTPIKHHLNEPQTPYFTAQMPKVITIDHTGNENILYVPVKAQAGYLNGYEDPTYLEHLPAFSMPGLRNGTYRMFEVQGQSMYPTLSSADKVIAQFIPDIKEIIENHIHIIIHQNGVAIKRVLNRIVERGKICLISDGHTRHKEYPAIELNADEIKEIWYVRMRITSQLHEPVELYTRMAEAELNISQILKKIGTI